MNAAETSASSAIADWTLLTVVSRSWTTAEMDTFINEVSTTRTNIAIESRMASRMFSGASVVGPASSVIPSPRTHVSRRSARKGHVVDDDQQSDPDEQQSARPRRESDTPERAPVSRTAALHRPWPRARCRISRGSAKVHSPLSASRPAGPGKDHEEFEEFAHRLALMKNPQDCVDR